MLSRRFYDSALKSPSLRNKGDLAITERELGNERLIPENPTMVHRNGHGSLISKWSLFPRPNMNICHFRTWRNVAE